MPNYAPYQLNKVQLGRETTAGTSVAATKILFGATATLDDARKRKRYLPQVGLLAPEEVTYDTFLLGKLALPQRPLTFQQFPYTLDAGIKTVTATGVGPYIWTYPAAAGATPNTVKTCTLEAGNVVVPTDNYKMEYSVVEEFSLTAKNEEEWMLSDNWFGRQLTQATMTAALAAPTALEVATLARTKLYIDAIGGTVGTTQKTGVLMGATMKVKTGLVYVPVGDGSLTFAGIKTASPPEITFTMVWEVEDSSVVAAERAFYRSATKRLFKWQIEGVTPASAKIEITWAGRYSGFKSYDNANGNTTITVEGYADYDTTAALLWQAIVTNQVATL